MQTIACDSKWDLLRHTIRYSLSETTCPLGLCGYLKFILLKAVLLQVWIPYYLHLNHLEWLLKCRFLNPTKNLIEFLEACWTLDYSLFCSFHCICSQSPLGSQQDKFIGLPACPSSKTMNSFKVGIVLFITLFFQAPAWALFFFLHGHI